MRKICLLIVSLLMGLTADAQRMREVFADMPDSLLVLLTRNNRLDCIDFIENNMPAKVRNRMDSYSELKVMTDDFLDMRLTDVSRLQMKLLPVCDTVNYICMVRTYDGPLPESVVRLYTSSWQPVMSKDVIPVPRFSDFWHAPDSLSADQSKALQRLMDLKLVQATLNAETPVLELTMSAADVAEERRADVAACLQSLRYEWNGKAFVRSR